MSLSLSPDDRRAIDLLLDRSSAVAGSGGSGFATEGVNPERLASAERVLQTLNLMPAGDPPADLLRRTLGRVDGSVRPERPATVPALADPCAGQAHA